MTKAGCQKVFNDKISGSRAERPGLTKALEMLREGDTLVVWKLDRLGRSVKHESIKKWGVFLFSLSCSYNPGDTQSLTELSIVQNENVCHQDCPSWRESDDLASASD